MKIFLICPVRGVGEDELLEIRKYVEILEKLGHDVYWPFRDTDQVDPIGLRICQDNRRAIEESGEVHVWWNEKSQGSIFDVGMAFALRKRIFLAKVFSVKETSERSFTNVLIALNAAR